MGEAGSYACKRSLFSFAETMASEPLAVVSETDHFGYLLSLSFYHSIAQINTSNSEFYFLDFTCIIVMITIIVVIMTEK